MSGELIDRYVERLEAQLRELISDSSPFLSGDVVDETSGTIILMDKLEDTITKCLELIEVGV